MAIFHGELSKRTFKRSIILCSADKKNNVLTFVIGVLLVHGDFGKNGQLHPYSRACLIFLVRQTSLLVQVVRRRSHRKPRCVEKM